MAMGQTIAPIGTCCIPHAMHHQLSTVRGGRLLPMRYSDEAACWGCVCHRTIAFSDCYHDLSTLRSATHRTCTHNAPCAGDACGWGHHGGWL